MCGIVGYVGPREAAEVLMEGLRRLEYRGYDSAGLATVDAATALHVAKTAGRIDRLAEIVARRPTPGHIGIGHTRWATHGPATDENAHPHLAGDGLVAVVHNGVIDNYRPLRNRLEAEGRSFRSSTDTEVIAHLIARALEELLQAAPRGNGMQRHLAAASAPRGATATGLPTKSAPAGDNGADREGGNEANELGSLLAADGYALLISAVEAALAQLHGTYGLAVLFRDCPEVILAARLGSPLVVGVGQGEHFVASDASALAGYTDQIVYLADRELAVVTAGGLRVVHRDHGHVKHQVQVLDFAPDAAELGPFAHYMLKEIFEQPESVQNTMRGRLSFDEATAHFGGLNLTAQQLRSIRRIVMTACGTSWHAALVGEYLIEELARIPVEVEYASELRYRNPPLEPDTILLAITQSGETADTLAALREIKRRGHHTLAICNVVGSTLAQEADGGIYLHAGPEIGVASTKAFTSQCVALVMLALYLGRMRHLSYAAGQRIIEQLHQLPHLVGQALEANEHVREIAEKYAGASNFLYLGRHYNFPVALEGALKLKEISYIHAEGYPAAEMKHGPIALVDENTPSVFLIPQGLVYDKVMANLEEIKARGGPVIAVTCEGGDQVAELADEVIHIPAVEDFLQPVVTSIPLQLLAYHIAVLRGCDVDKPRNLAKSVTVE